MSYWVRPGIELPAIDSVCKVFKVSHKELAGRSRLQNIARARQVFMYVDYLTTPDWFKSLDKTARKVNRSHCTALYSINAIKTEMSYNKKVASDVNEVLKLMNFGHNINNEAQAIPR